LLKLVPDHDLLLACWPWGHLGTTHGPTASYLNRLSHGLLRGRLLLGYHLWWLRLAHSSRTLLLSRVNHHSSLRHWGLLLSLEVLLLLHLGSLLLHQLHHLLSLGRHSLWIHHLSHVDRSVGNLLSHRNDWELLLLLRHRRHGRLLLLLHIGLLVHHGKLLLLLLLWVLAHPWLCSENRLLLVLTCQNCRGCLSLGLLQLGRTRYGHACCHGAAIGDSLLLLLRGGRFLLDPPISFCLDQLATRPLPPSAPKSGWRRLKVGLCRVLRLFLLDHLV